MKQTLVALAILCFSQSAFPCRVLPAGLLRDQTMLVNEASSILLVDVIANPKTEGESCQFNVVRTLKGIAPEVIPFVCRLPDAGELKTHFSGHSEPGFWEKNGGRLGTNDSCNVDSPSFQVGHNYLFILGIAQHKKQFEEIAGPTDQWLLFIEQQLSQRKP